MSKDSNAAETKAKYGAARGERIQVKIVHSDSPCSSAGLCASMYAGGYRYCEAYPLNISHTVLFVHLTMCVNLMQTTENIDGLNWYYLAMAFGIGLISMLIKRFGKESLRFKRVQIANSQDECRSVAVTLRRKCKEFNALGFDCEWVTLPSGRCPVALLQLASIDGYCALIRFSNIWNSGNPSSIPLELQELLEDSTILKVGVVPSDDANYLFKDYGIVVHGCVDLRHLVAKNGGTSHGGLSGLAENVLRVKMDKSWIIRCSNWEASELSERQISYAANDAWVAVKIFEVLMSGRLKRSRISAVEWVRKQWQCLMRTTTIPSYVYEYADIKFHKKVNSYNVGNEYRAESLISPVNITKQKPVKTSKQIPRAFCTRQSPLYHNCFMQAPDGAVLCTCDRKKAIWYVSKGLAELITEDPVTVRLKFEPSGRAIGSVGQYYVQTKSNCCVVCGKIDNCIRKNIVPHEYRKYFPKIMKDHVSHDVLLLCLPCHLRSNSYDMSLKRHLAELCNAPFCQGGNAKYNVNRDKSAVKAAAKALIRSCEKIPIERRHILKHIVQDYYNVAELTDEILWEARKINTFTPNEDYDPHGLKIVQYFSIESNGGLVKLEQRWREHFLKTMNPKYMPNLWSVTHTQDRLAIRAAENRILPDELCVAGMKDCVPLLEPAKYVNKVKRSLENISESQDKKQ